MKKWIDKYGFWAIAFLSFQPVLPIELGDYCRGGENAGGQVFTCFMGGQIPQISHPDLCGVGFNQIPAVFKSVRRFV